MNRIKKVEIKNFRNIVYDSYDYEGQSVVIKGNNEIGKTNRLQAILWAIGGVMFDGTIRDALSNITPDGADSGLETSVSITFMNGEEITKTYSRPFEVNSLGERVYGRAKTTFIVNGGKPLSRIADGEMFILQQLGLADLSSLFASNNLLSKINLPFLLNTTKGILGLNNATQRELIVDIVGDVDAIEIAENNPQYAILLDELRKLKGDVNALRDKQRYSIQNKDKGLEQQVFVAKSVLEELELQAKKSVDETQLKEAKEAIAEIDKAINEIELNKTKSKNELVSGIDLKLSNLENEKLRLEQTIRDKYRVDLDAFNKELGGDVIKNKQAGIRELEHAVSLKKIAYENAIRNKKTATDKLNAKKQEIADILNTAKKLKVRYSEVNNKEISKGEKITCPKCNESFDINYTLENQERHKQHIAKELKEIIDTVKKLGVKKEQAEYAVKDLENSVVVKDDEIKKALTDYNSSIEIVNKAEKQLDDLVEKAQNSTIIKPTLDFDTKPMLDIKNKIQTLKNEKSLVLEKHQDQVQKYDDNIAALKERKTEYEEITIAEKVMDQNLRTLKEKRVEYDRLVNELALAKESYRLSKELLVDIFKELERRIKVKFGDNVYFKLYEPNVSDKGETYKTDICEMYVKDGFDRLVPALANGVSTSMQELRLIEFIERLKEHYKVENSFILLDRLESLDNNKRKELSRNNQIITTAVVSDTPKVEYEII